MRPPEFTGGNTRNAVATWSLVRGRGVASMRPPEFTGGNMELRTSGPASSRYHRCFNEAAGIHRRKRYGEAMIPTTTVE